MSERTSAITAVQKQTSAVLGDIRQAVVELTAILRPGRRVDEELLLPVRRLVQGLASVAELVVDPIVLLVDFQRRFVESQRDLADQMAAWADLQHQLADRIAAWADLQRQIADAVDKSFAPVSGAAHLTSRLLQDAAGARPSTTQRRPKEAAPRARAAKKSQSSPQISESGREAAADP